MYERDYILRLITQVGQMLRAMLHAIREQRPEDALETARDAVEALLDTDAGLADALTGEGLVTFLAAGGQIDVLRARLLAEVLVERSHAFDAVGDAERSANERMRAQALLDAAAPIAEGEDAAHVASLREALLLRLQ